MKSLRQSVWVNAPRDKVFEWTTWSPNLVGVWPTVLKSDNYKRDENGLGSQDVTYMMAGMRIKVHTDDVERVENEKIVVHSKVGLESYITWTFHDQDDGTLIVFYVEYNIPVPVIGPFAESIVVAVNQTDITVMLKNLKRKLEELFQPEVA